MPSTQRLSDAALVRRSQQGDRRAFAALVSRYDRRLRGLAHALLLDPAHMDAALGMAYLRAWRDVVRVKPRDDVGPWLYRAAYNACVDLLRRNDGQGPVQPPAGGAPGGLRAALAGLAPADRVAVVLVEREGFSVASAARILGMSPEQLEPRLAAARETLAPFVPAPAPVPAATTADEDEPAAEAAADEAVEQPVVEDEAAEVEAADAEAADDGALVDESAETEAGEEATPDAPVGEVTPTGAPAPEPAADVATQEDADVADPIVETVTDAVEPATPAGEPAAAESTEATEVAGNGKGRGNGSGNGHDSTGGGAADSTVATTGNGHADRAGNRGRGRRSRRRANGAAAAAAKAAGDGSPDRDDNGEASGIGQDARDVGEPAGAASTTGEHRIADG